MKKLIVLLLAFVLLVGLFGSVAATGPKIGVKVENGSRVDNYPDLHDDGKFMIIRANWNELEPDYDGPGALEYDDLDYTKLDARIDGIDHSRLILLFHGTPAWRRSLATDNKRYECAVPSLSVGGGAHGRADWWNFVEWTIERYEPFGILVWNEPTQDPPYPIAPPYWSDDPQPVGCMDMDEYIELAIYTYDEIKDREPSVQIGIANFNETIDTDDLDDFYDAVDPYDGRYYDVIGMHNVARSTDSFSTNNDRLLEEIDDHRSRMSGPYLWLTEAFYQCFSGSPPVPSTSCSASPFENNQAGWLDYLALGPEEGWPSLVAWGAMMENTSAVVGSGLKTYMGALAYWRGDEKPVWDHWEAKPDWP